MFLNNKVSHRTVRVIGVIGVICASVASPAAWADPLPTGSLLLTKHVNKAADYYEKGDYASAKEEFRAAIGFAPRAVEPYEGLLECSRLTRDWPDVAFAAEKINTLSPDRTKMYEYDYGTALYNLNRYDEAIPHLKSALITANLPVPVFRPIKLTSPEEGTNTVDPPVSTGSSSSSSRSLNSQITQMPPLPGFLPAPPTSALDIMQSGSHSLSAAERERREYENKVTSASSVDNNKLANFDNAIRSEFIGIAEYQTYDKSDDIRFNSPPATHWHITKILKGPPLNKALPLRYDFHTLAVKEPPAGRHFDESKLPQKGSKWILFIEFAVPEGPKKLFTTYDGSYGRQLATEKNLNELDELLEEHKMRNQGL